MGEAHRAATLGDVERQHILATLTVCEGNRTRAAEVLGISVRCLRNKLRGYVESGFAVEMPKTGLGRSAVRTKSGFINLTRVDSGSDRVVARSESEISQVTDCEGRPNVVVSRSLATPLSS